MNKKLSVLIVDDNEEFVRRMVDLLDELNNISSIQTAANYQDAFRMLDNKDHDIVLLDIQLPGKSGISLLQKIQELEWRCAVIMITNSAGISYKRECEKLGARFFLDKSSEFEQVTKILSGFNPN